MATAFSAQPESKRPGARRWRGALAALISLALALSFLHSSGFGDDIAPVAAVQASCDASGKEAGKSAPDWGAPHGDHCLAHVTAVTPHDNAVPIEYVTRVQRLATVPAPESAELAAPFEPPRA